VVAVPDADAGAGVPPVCSIELSEVPVCGTEVDVVVPSGLVLGGGVVVAAGSSVAAGVVVAG
jgi:hypothetical protein